MNSVKRLALYVFYDKDGYVGDYVKYYIKALKEIAHRVIFIVNGLIQPDGRKDIENTGAEIFQRENKGLDFGAWKDIILNVGFHEISGYDELVLCNCSCYGPVYPLADVFSEMEARNCDFWGITKHPATGNLIIKNDPASVIIEHIQSYFLVLSRRVITSDAFQKWWYELEPTSSYSAEVAYHENKFTKYLHDSSFSYDTYVDCDKYFKHNCPYTPSFACAYEMLTEDRDPFIKKKLFLNSTRFWTITGEGFTPVITINKLKETSYNVLYIYSDLLRNQKISDIKDAIALTWVHKKAKHYSKRRLALVCHASCRDLAEYMSSYMSNMPDGSDLYLISSKQEVLDAYKKLFEQSETINIFNKITYLLQPENVGDIASLVVTFAPYYINYDGFCFIHDQQESETDTYPFVQDVLKRSLRCSLESKEYVKDLVEALFENSSHCGVMLPPTPYFSKNISFGKEIVAGATKQLKSLFERLHLNVRFDAKLMAPFENMFWARTDALKDLFDGEWNYEDFAEEPAKEDHSISYAVQRVICFCAQNRGYFPKWAMPESFAELYINNLSYRLRDFNIELNRVFRNHSFTDHLNLLKSLPSAGSPGEITAKPATNAAEKQNFSCWKYLLYKLLYKITFGHRKKHYRKKYKALKTIKRERRIRFF